VLTAVIASAQSTGIWMAVGGTIAVLAISAVFYVVGRGEDREREQAARPPPPPDGAPQAPRPRPPRANPRRRRP